MDYKIKEVHVMYEDNKLEVVAVLWVSDDELELVRASYCTTSPTGGYKFLVSGDILTDQLVQRVAGQGMNLPDELKLKYFPGRRNWSR